MDKTAIKNFAIESRKILRESAIKKAGMYGITIDECSKPIQKGADFEVYKTIAGDEIRLYSKELKMRSNLVNVINEKGFEQVIEETAYTWFNRLIAIRFMEVNDYLPTRVRVLSSETGSSTPDIVTHALDVDLNLSGDEIDKIQAAKDDNMFDDAFQLLFVKQCNELNKILPGLFEATNDYMELLLDISYTSDGVVRMLVDEVPEDDFNVEKEGQVEIIGWLYQYYNTELKDDTFAKLKKNIKITKERIPAATQLFTPDWIVRYMVENSLGRVWIDHLRAVDESADEKKISEEFGWKYYLPEAEQEADVAAELVKVRADRRDLKPQDITCIDPCCGSGHILVYMFDVLLQIYESEGISVRDAVFDILEKNIHGLDIDVRAYQLSYFALMMKGRGAAGRRFFRGVETEDGSNRPVALNVYAIDESNDIDRSALSFLGKGMLEIEKNTAEAQVNRLLDEMTDAKEYGSIINVTECDWELIDKYLNSISEDGQLSFGYISAVYSISHIRLILSIGKLLTQKYNAVVTNPPYMSLGNSSATLGNYIKKYYSDVKMDLYSTFIQVCAKLSSDRNYFAMITQQSWMFLSSFEKVRQHILKSTIINMVHLGARAFEEIGGEVVQTTAFVINNSDICQYRSTYSRLVSQNSQVQKEDEYLRKNNIFISSKMNFNSIPGIPIAYWVKDKVFDLYKTMPNLKKYCAVKNGMSTTNNNKFLRHWSECNFNKLGFGYSDAETAKESNKKWFPYNKGGEFRKWYGNIGLVVNWENNGEAIKKAAEGASGGRIVSQEYYFHRSVSWSKVSSGKFALRFYPEGFLFDVAGPSIFAEYDMQLYIMGIINSCLNKVCLQELYPTMNYEMGQVSSFPVLYDKTIQDTVIEIVKRNIEISKEDWDLSETSWDFIRSPLVPKEKGDYLISDCVSEFYCLNKNRLEELTTNEKKLNSIFIKLYGLNQIVSESDNIATTLHEENEKEEIIDLISYAVGCMFGRYSLNSEKVIPDGCEKLDDTLGLIDDDNIIPITDEEYFEDDIVIRLEKFIKICFGEKYLESNMRFIADKLGYQDISPRDGIRKYFLDCFYQDHLKKYSAGVLGKKPIYWLFDSGKQNGFKCLIYMHRYTPDTVGLIRSVYLKKAQDAIEASLKNAEYVIANTESAVDRAANTRKRDKYIKQLAEIKPYYQALSHVAMQRIDIDLDDGVKVNYARFQAVEVGGEGEKKQTINLLAKI